MFFSTCYGYASPTLNKLINKTKSTNELQYQLTKAVMCENLSKIEELLACNFSINFFMKDNWRLRLKSNDIEPGLPLIHLAAMMSRKTSLDALINAGVNVNVAFEIPGSAFESGSILMNTFTEHLTLPIYERLINAGADVTFKNSKGVSVLIAFIDLLENEDFIINEEQNLYESKIAILKLLISHGAIPSNADVTNILQFIASEERKNSDMDIDILQLCLDKNIELVPKTGTNILHTLVKKLESASVKRLVFIKKIIDTGIDLNAQDEKGRTALYLATYSECLNVIELLLQQKDAEGNAKVDINLPEYYGITPLHVAAQNRKQCLEILLAYKANINVKTSSDESVVYYAVNNVQLFYSDTDQMSWRMIDATTNAQTLELLLKAGAKVDESNYKGMTPLMAAAISDNIESVKFLIEGGANVWSKDKKNREVLFFAQSESIRSCISTEQRRQHAGVQGKPLLTIQV